MGPPGLEPGTVRLSPDGQALPADRDPSRPGQSSLAVFKTAAFNRSATSPHNRFGRLERISGGAYPANIQHLPNARYRKNRVPKYAHAHMLPHRYAELGSNADASADEQAGFRLSCASDVLTESQVESA